MTDILLEFCDVSLELGGKQILQDVSFAVRRGEYVSLLGQNGAGKTTLLRCALGILKPERGAILVGGQKLGALPRREVARLMAYVPQDIELPFPLSVFDLVLMGRFPHLGFMHNPGRRDEEAALEALKTCAAEQFAGRDLQSLSGGEKQRVLIAAALAQEPAILLLDEVCHFLDPRHEQEVQALLMSLHKEQAKALLSVTHDVNRAVFHSDRIVALKQGKVVFDGLPSEFVDKGVLEVVYEKKFLFAKHPQSGLKVIVPDV